MSNAGARQRRTVPLEFSSHHAKNTKDSGDHSVPTTEVSSLVSSSLSAGISSPAVAQSGSRKKNKDTSVSTRKLEPIRNSYTKPPSTHSRGESTISAPNSISISELKRSMSAKRRQNRQSNTIPSDPRTPSGHAKLFSIGSDNSPLDVLAYPPPLTAASSESSQQFSDLLGLEKALQESGLGYSFSESRRATSLTNTPFSARTPFEVDAPRDVPSSLRRLPSSGMSVASEPTNPHLSEEQDAWAGIDALLETKSLDDSFTFSTSDILPRATVRAMRRGSTLRGVDEASVLEDDSKSEAGESRTSKRSLESISKGSSASSSNSSRAKGRSSSRKTKGSAKNNSGDTAADFSASQASTNKDDSWNELEGKDKAGELRRISNASSEGGLFDMFQWSEKDNVDEQRQRKGKLNSKLRKVQINMPSKLSNHSSDEASLPSLASFRPDDFSTRSDARSVGCDTYYSRDLGSVVTEDHEYAMENMMRYRHENGGSEAQPVSEGSSGSENSSGSRSRNSLAGDGLVLDKGVDEYIRKIQLKLPTIIEDDDSVPTKGKKKKKNVGYMVDEEQSSPSPTSVVPEETAFDELPSLKGPSGLPFGESPRLGTKKGRMEEKKDTSKPSLTYLMNTFKKKVSATVKTRKQLGDEEKYFPDAVKADKSKKYSANRCLLSEGDDGVNWDTD